MNLSVHVYAALIVAVIGAILFIVCETSSPKTSRMGFAAYWVGLLAFLLRDLR